MAEVRREGDKIIRTKNNNLFSYTGTTRDTKGIGFIVNEREKY